MNPKILFIGAGNMGGAILEAGIKGGIIPPETTFVLEQNAEKVADLQKRWGIQTGDPGDAEIIILAVKPQGLDGAFPLAAAPDALLVSVLAGVSTKRLSQVSGLSQICRAMPNTPALAQCGMTALFFTDAVKAKNRDFCERLFSACGEAIELQNEDEMHAVTALSGSGPAYFFQFVEGLTEAGKALGLSEAVAEKLAKETFFGSAALLMQSKENAAILRRRVTSQGGTTEAALKVFETADLMGIIQAALKAAAKRSRELGGE